MLQTDLLIRQLIQYGLHCGLLDPLDETYATNLLLSHLGLSTYVSPGSVPDAALADILHNLIEDAAARGLLDRSSTAQRDLFDTKLMSALLPRPAEVIRRFWEAYQTSPQQATDFYYRFCCDSDYIRRYRIQKDLKWVTKTEYGELDITINLSKPEKDPKAIAAAAKSAGAPAYPPCALCRENEGYAGRLDHPARQTLRMIPLSLCGEGWFLQYSPYVYYPEHCIVLSKAHRPMAITPATFDRLFDFIRQFPHYFVGSNADLPIVGGSILSHEHFQGGRYRFAMEKAPVETPFSVSGFPDVSAGIVKWPMSVLRLSCADAQRVSQLAAHILKRWRAYSDHSAFLFAQTGGTPHNTITPIARMRGDKFELDLVLRNNITTKQYPLGVFHPHPEYHHIKKENIGLIEVMGLAVLPARLKDEMQALARALVTGENPRQNPAIQKHADWGCEIAARRTISQRTVEAVLQEEIGLAYSRILEQCAVFPRTPNGRDAFVRFLSALG